MTAKREQICATVDPLLACKMREVKRETGLSFGDQIMLTFRGWQVTKDGRVVTDYSVGING